MKIHWVYTGFFCEKTVGYTRFCFCENSLGVDGLFLWMFLDTQPLF